MSSKAKIVHRPDFRGGSPTIEGTRIAVTDIVQCYRMYLPDVAARIVEPPDLRNGSRIPLGPVLEKIQNHLPHLSLAQIRAALAYWRQHQPEIEAELGEEELLAGELERKYSRLP